MYFRYFSISLLISLTAVSASGTMPYQDKSLSAKERAVDLVSRLTLDEKISLMMYDSPSIERLGIPAYNWWNEALHGVGRAGLATVLPQSIGMAATFDPDALQAAFSMVSDEARAKFNDANSQGNHGRYSGLTFWTPNINIFRDPRWGRGQETYGEDPYLTAKMGVAVVKGLQGDGSTPHIKTIAGAKHFAVHSGPEWNRHSFDAADIHAEDLWGTYLPAFKALVDAGVGQVMCAYNRLEGEPCCGNDRLLTGILRNEWGYNGIIVTDCWALNDFFLPGYHETHSDGVQASAAAVMSGADLECGPAFANLSEAIERGLINESKIDESLTRILCARFELGEIDGDNDNEWADLDIGIVGSEAHGRIALDMARKSMTLLKNNGILPLSKNDKSILVMGPNANDSVMQWGNYNGVPGHTVTILEGIQSKNSGISYSHGCDHVIDNNITSVFNLLQSNGKPGMTAIYHNGNENNRQVAEADYTSPLNLSTGNATAWAPNVNLEDFNVTFSGTFIPEKSGNYIIKLFADGNGGQTVEINGKRAIVNFNEVPIHDNFYIFEAEAGKEYKIDLFYTHEKGLAHLKFDIGEPAPYNYNLDSISTVIFVGGISPALEGEEMPVSLPGFRGGDRESIELPAIQREFMRKLKQQGKSIVFVNCSGSAVALAPEDSICDAILQAWYPGQEGGTAVADVLFGDYNPAGRLPVTFYRSDSQLPDYEDYDMSDRTYRYMTVNPLYPFGHGLSYSSFEYSVEPTSIKVKRNEPVNLTVNVTNTSNIDGEDVVQVYVKKNDDFGGPLRNLKAFKRINIAAGTTVPVEFSLEPDAFATFDIGSGRMKITPGYFTVYFGGSSAAQNSLSVILE